MKGLLQRPLVHHLLLLDYEVFHLMTLRLVPGYIYSTVHVRYLTSMTDSLQGSDHSNGSDSEKTYHSIELDPLLASRVWLKLDLYLLPIVAAIHLLSYLARRPHYRLELWYD